MLAGALLDNIENHISMIKLAHNSYCLYSMIAFTIRLPDFIINADYGTCSFYNTYDTQTNEIVWL